MQQPRTHASFSPTARLFQHQTSPRLRSQMTSIVMLSAPPAACGQTRHFNYCALVDGDVRREALRTDRVYSPHHVPATISGLHAETRSGQVIPVFPPRCSVQRLPVLEHWWFSCHQPIFLSCPPPSFQKLTCYMEYAQL